MQKETTNSMEMPMQWMDDFFFIEMISTQPKTQCFLNLFIQKYKLYLSEIQVRFK
jgi:hypothetical protein